MIAWPPPPKSCGEAVNLSGRRRSRNHGKRGIFGDPLKRTTNNSIRIVLHNVGGIGFITGKRCHETLKMGKLHKVVIENSVDICWLTEVNKDWRLHSYDRLELKVGKNTGNCKFLKMLQHLLISIV